MTVDADKERLPNESGLRFLRRKRRFHELLIDSWSIVEYSIDQLLTRQYGLYNEYSEPKVQTLTNLSFERKLQSLKKMGVLSPEEYQTIHSFKESRNEFFHKLGGPILFAMSDDEKDRTMDKAVEVAELTAILVSSRFDQPYVPKSKEKTKKQGVP